MRHPKTKPQAFAYVTYLAIGWWVALAREFAKVSVRGVKDTYRVYYTTAVEWTEPGE